MCRLCHAKEHGDGLCPRCEESVGVLAERLREDIDREIVDTLSLDITTRPWDDDEVC